MKKLFKALLASTLLLSLAACSDEEDDPNDKPIVIDDIDWRDGLEGYTEYYTITYDGEERNIILEANDTAELNFYFDEEEQNKFTSIFLYYGHFDDSVVLSTVSFMDTDSNGYDDITFSYTDQDDHYITAEYDYNIDNGQYEISTFNSNEGIPPEEYQDVWYYNADKTLDSFVVDQWGNWAEITSDGQYLRWGYVYYDDTWGCYLYNNEGMYVGSLEIEDDTWLVVTLDGLTDQYARQENSTNGQ